MDDQLATQDLDRDFSVGEHNVKLPHGGDPAAAKANVLSNILESLDAQGGSSGPASIMLREENC